MITRTQIINFLFEIYGFQKYLEIGVWYPANNFDKINASSKESVDPFPKGKCTYVMTSDDFFINHVKNKKYDVIFIDALHTHEQSYKDVCNAINCLNDDGFIIMHDCNPQTEYFARSYDEFLKTGGCWNGTVYKAFLQLKCELKDWCCFVVNEDYGCGILTKKNLFKTNNISLDINAITWNEFNKNRNNLLDLVTYDFYEKIIIKDKSIGN